jgi:two-component system, cell cycle sensor histidine kinase and response regulator CckA
LTVVLTNTSLLHGELPPQSAEARRSPAEIEMAVHRGASMIRKLLAFSRRETVHAVPIRIVTIASEAVDNLRRLIPAAVDIRTEFVDDVPPVLADADAVEQMLFSLATNARDAMPNGGRLTVAVDRASVGEAAARSLQGRAGEYVTVSVTDTGTGMDRATAIRALEPFFTTKATGEGTGLGLAMVLGLMQQHQGFLEIASVVDRGTTVRLYFPVAPQGVVAEPAPPAPPARPTSQQTILLVEDEPFLRAVAERSLKRLGYSVVAAADGEEGLRLFEEHKSRIVLVFSDAVMPKLGGVDLLKELRSRGHAVPFILTSGYSERDLRTLEGASAPVVQKPWSFTDLARVVQKVLGDKTQPTSNPAERTGDG